MGLLISIIISLTSLSLQAQPIVRLLSGEEVSEVRKNATLAVERYSKGIINDDATAIWIGDEGYIVTSFHIIDGSVDNKDQEVRLFDRQNNRIEFVVVSCGDNRKIDLCLLKSKERPSSYFPIRKTKIGEGHTAYWIGHTNFRSYTAQETQILRFYKDTSTEIQHGEKTRPYLKNIGVASVAHTNQQCKGCSGGPLFDSQGNLLGMLDRFYSFPKKLNLPSINLAINADEIFNYYEKHKLKK